MSPMGFYRKQPKQKRKPCKKQIVTVNIPNQYTEAMDIMIDLGMINSRSELVREALKLFLENDKEFRNDLEVKFMGIMSVNRTELGIV